MLRRLFNACLCLAALTVGAALGQPTPRYAITDLGTLPGGDHSAAYGINNVGQVVGWSDGGSQAASDVHDYSAEVMIQNHAVVWNKGRMLDLGLLKGFPFSAAKAINGKGQIVGGWDIHYYPGGGGMGGGERQTFLRQNGQMTVFSNFSPAPFLDDLTAINDKGEMVGDGFPNHVYPKHPLAYIRGKWTDLGLLPGGTEGVANGINNKGEIVGWVMGNPAAKTNRDYRAFLYRNGKMSDLGNQLTGAGQADAYYSKYHFSEAFAINDKDQIAGVLGGLAAFWDKGAWHLIGGLPDYSLTTAYAINDSGQIVGEGGNGLYLHTHAFLYQGGTLLDLNDLVSPDAGWILRTARGINDKGQIVGSGQHAGKDRAYLLTPIP